MRGTRLECNIDDAPPLSFFFILPDVKNIESS